MARAHFDRQAIQASDFGILSALGFRGSDSCSMACAVEASGPRRPGWRAEFLLSNSSLPKAACRVYFRPGMPTIILIILAILLPPLAVYLKTNSGKQTIINLILCLFFWVPGVLHALYLILAKK